MQFKNLAIILLFFFVTKSYSDTKTIQLVNIHGNLYILKKQQQLFFPNIKKKNFDLIEGLESIVYGDTLKTRSQDASLKYDKEKNSIEITANPKKIEQITRIINVLDIKHQEVALTLRIFGTDCFYTEQENFTLKIFRQEIIKERHTLDIYNSFYYLLEKDANANIPGFARFVPSDSEILWPQFFSITPLAITKDVSFFKIIVYLGELEKEYTIMVRKGYSAKIGPIVNMKNKRKVLIYISLGKEILH